LTKPQKSPEKYLEYFFHLPTLITLALIGLVLLWKIYDVGFYLGPNFARLTTHFGSVSIDWVNGCCNLSF